LQGGLFYLSSNNLGFFLHPLLKRWLINHIQGDDAAYIKPVRAHLKKLENKDAKTDKKAAKSSWVSRAVKKFLGG
jgi:hemerythrin